MPKILRGVIVPSSGKFGISPNFWAKLFGIYGDTEQAPLLPFYYKFPFFNSETAKSTARAVNAI
jgi:hypothetical protein